MRKKISNLSWQWQVFLLASLLSALLYGLLDLQTAFSTDWIVQDDARQHVFWLNRYAEPGLFPNDFIADYFQSVAPWGYTSLYRLGLALGIDPFVFGKLIPIPLRIITAYYFFLWCRTIFPVPLGCLTTTLLINHSLWLKDDIVSATPRAFLNPFFLAFLLYFNHQKLIPCLISLIILSLFYPQMVMIAWVMLLLKLIRWHKFAPSITPNIKERNFAIIGLIIGFLVLLPYAVKTSDYAPIITRAEAFAMPEFHSQGRADFFKDTIWGYLFGSGRGIMISKTAFRPSILYVGLLLPLLRKKPNQFPLVRKITPQFNCVSKLVIASLAMYLLAQLVLFKLHLPSRYTSHSLRIMVNLCGGIAIAIILDSCWRYWQKKHSPQKSKLFISVTVIAVILFSHSSFFDYSLTRAYKITGYEIGRHPKLYEYLKQQPKDTVIASLTKETNYLPSFSKRSVLVSSEYAVPYQLGYYKPFADKVKALITAQYSPDLNLVKTFIQQHHITHWIIEDRSFNLDFVTKNRWIKQYREEYNRVVYDLKNNQTSALLKNKDLCTTFISDELTVMDAKCILKL